MNASPAGPKRGKVVRKVRNEHGTRVARRIRCASCGAEDTIDFAPKDPSQVLCRRCAFDQYGAIDPDDPSVRRRSTTCPECRRSFEAVISLRHPEPPICPDCRAGIISQQQHRTKKAVRLSAKVVRARKKPQSGESEPL